MDTLEDVCDRVREYWADDDSDDDSIETVEDSRIKRFCGRIFFSFFSPLTRQSIFILSCIAVPLDPLFCYIPIIDEKDKCLEIDKNLRTAAFIFRALPDATFTLRTIISGYNIYTDSITDDSLEILYRIHSCGIIGFAGILVAVSLILPIPQLLIAVLSFKPESFGHFGQRVTVTVFIIFNFLARTFLLYISIRDKMHHAGVWVRAILNLFLYIVAGHIFGSFWYLASIQREISCWYRFCENTKACSSIYHCSDSTSRNTTFINELCPTNPPNATALNFGIFFDAVESGITRSKHFRTRFLYCLWWGVRNLSNFGTNLQTSTYEWENCFAVAVSISGMILFLYFLGNMQIYLQDAAKKILDADELKPKIVDKKKAIRTWMKTNGVPHDTVRIRRRNLVKHIDAEVDVNLICSVVADHQKGIIQRRICEEKLKRVNKLPELNQKRLLKICKFLKPKIFQADDKIFEAGKPLNWMIYIVSGTVSTDPPTTETFEKGMFVGEQLLDWVTRTNKTFPNQPHSEKTLLCSSKVEAFVLSVEDLKTLACKGILPKNSGGDEA